MTQRCERFCTAEKCVYCSGTGKIPRNPRIGLIGGDCRHCEGGGRCLYKQPEKKPVAQVSRTDLRSRLFL